MRPLFVIAGMTALLLGAGACGQAADQGAPASQPTPTSVSPGPPSVSAPQRPSSKPIPPEAGAPPTATTPPEGAVLLPKSQVDTSALPEYYAERNVWSVNDGRTLALNAMAPNPCTGVTARLVEENDRMVRITIAPMDVPQGGPPDGPGVCAQVVTPRVLTVDLAAPIGDRKVVVTEGS